MATDDITTSPTAQPTQPDNSDFSFEAIFTGEQVREMEENHNETWGVNRRLTMITLSRSKDQLKEGFLTAGEEVLVSAFDRIEDYKKYLNSSIELADAAMARLAIVAETIATTA